MPLAPDEVWGRDAIIRGKDGVEHERIPDCPYPRYDLGGNVLPAGAAGDGQTEAQASGTESGPPSPQGWRRRLVGTYDGWITWYDSNQVTVAANSKLVTEWVVPLPPKTIGSQDIAFFNDFETKDIILQPVLDFSEIPGAWAIESENCCGPTGNGNDVQSALVQVSPGDVLRGGESISPVVTQAAYVPTGRSSRPT